MRERVSRLWSDPDRALVRGAIGTSLAGLGLHDLPPTLTEFVVSWFEALAEAGPWHPSFVASWADGPRDAVDSILSFGAVLGPLLALATLFIIGLFGFRTGWFEDVNEAQWSVLRPVCYLAYAQTGPPIVASVIALGSLLFAAVVTVVVIAVELAIVVLCVIAMLAILGWFLDDGG
jgi:hypothetical protein